MKKVFLVKFPAGSTRVVSCKTPFSNMLRAINAELNLVREKSIKDLIQ